MKDADDESGTGRTGDPDWNAVRSTQWRRRTRRRTTEFRPRSWCPATGGAGK